MLGIETSLVRLKESVGQFVVPTIALRNVHLLKAQIEFRREALREIETIRGQLRPFGRHDAKRLQRRRFAKQR
jgi:hypothetical protein